MKKINNNKYMITLKVKWVLRSVVYFINAIIWTLDAFYPDPKIEDRYTVIDEKDNVKKDQEEVKV